MEKAKRLSLDDFKLGKLEGANEIDKLLAGTAASCHTEPCTRTVGNTTYIYQDPID
jgi:hypothetical protein